MFDFELLCELPKRPWKTNFIVLLVLSFQNTWLNVFSHGLVHDVWYWVVVLTFLFKIFKLFPRISKTYPDISHKTKMSPKLKCHYNWNVIKTEMSPKKNHPNWNITKTEMSLKLKCQKLKCHEKLMWHQNWNVTKTRKFTLTEMLQNLRVSSKWNLNQNKSRRLAQIMLVLFKLVLLVWYFF